MGSLRKKNVAKMENPFVEQQEAKAERYDKKKRALVRRLTLYAACALLFAILSVSTILAQHSALEAKQKEKAKMETKLSELQKKETLLREEIVMLNDDDYIAKLARRDYFLSEDGEIIFNLPKSDKEGSD
ncbi:FtsB family cell division protein [Bacillus massiliglaciei]|uniref:FtsB family cell division protein n=1 Tax=Bacillus massiliglaciei TaxID=1816693 RepID=UPI000DA5FD80|nr:septum formation initiator family protein [Bacillus massiliglaciei]